MDSNAQIHARLQRPIGLQTQAFPAQVNGDCGLPRAISRAKKRNLDRTAYSESPPLSSFGTGFDWVPVSFHRIAPLGAREKGQKTATSVTTLDESTLEEFLTVKNNFCHSMFNLHGFQSMDVGQD
jgi:hypothetical protein